MIYGSLSIILFHKRSLLLPGFLLLCFDQSSLPLESLGFESGVNEPMHLKNRRQRMSAFDAVRRRIRDVAFGQSQRQLVTIRSESIIHRHLFDLVLPNASLPRFPHEQVLPLVLPIHGRVSIGRRRHHSFLQP